MKLREIEIRRLPGIERGFHLGTAEIGPHVTLVHGPNAAGKSSLCRAVSALLWPQKVASREIDVVARFTVGGPDATRAREYVVERFGDHVAWRADGVPTTAPRLPPMEVSRCFTIDGDDLRGLEGDDLAAKDGSLAAEIGRHMAGGFDLPAVAEGLHSRLRRARSDSALREAQRQLTDAQKEHSRVDGERAELADLEARSESAKKTSRRARDLEAALEVRTARDDALVAEAEIASFPDGMRELAGDELERLEICDDRIAAERAKLAESDEEIRRAESEIERAALSDGGLPTREFAELRSRAEALRHREVEIARFEDDARAAIGALESAQKRLHPSRVPRLDSSSLARVEAHLTHADRVARERAELDGELAVRDDEPPADAPELLAKARARDEAWRVLSAWLAIPDEASDRARWLVLACAMIASIALAVLAHPAWIALAIVACGAALASGARAKSRSKRAECVLAYSRLPLDPPSAWARADVERRLHELSGEIAENLAARERDSKEEAHRDRLARKRAQLDRESADLAAERASVADELGIDPPGSDLALYALARLVVDCGAAETESDARRARWTAARAAHETAARELSRAIERYGVRGGSDAAALSAGMASLAERVEAHAQATRVRDGARRSRDDAIRRLAELELDRAALVGTAGGERELAERLELRDAWKKAQHALADARSRERAAFVKLESSPELAELTRERIEAELDRAQQTADESAALGTRIALIRAEVERLTREHDLEDALARVAEAVQSLRERRDEVLDDEAALCLVEDVQERATHTATSPVFQRAAEWFARFTHHAFELRIGADRTFRAYDTRADAQRLLSELSSGTRAQLLLAARVAYAMEAEGETPLPIFLDEALSNSDPERFAEVARSLALLARESDRQVVYLSSDPADAERWLRATPDSPPVIVDLAALRGIQSAPERDVVLLPIAKRIPSPDDQTPEQYGRAIGVPALDPFAEVESIHLYYLVSDDLALLHRLLERRIDRLGPLRSIARTPESRAYVSASELERVEAWARAYEATAEAWRVGRGRRVTRDVLVAAGVSDVYIEDVCDIASKVDGHAKALMACLKGADSRPRGWRTAKTQEIGEHLAAHGYLDPRDALPEHEVLERALVAAARAVEAGVLAAERVAERAEQWSSLFARESERASVRSDVVRA